MSAMNELTCIYCGAWIGYQTTPHWCPQMNPNQPDVHHHVHQAAEPGELRRIADALERIAKAMEGDNG